MLSYITSLPSWQLTLGIGITLLLYLLSIILFDPLRSIPGPLLARYTRLWYILAIRRGNFARVNIALHRKHGWIVRIAPGQYSIDDASAAKTIYGHGSEFPKSEWYAAWTHPDPKRWTLFSDRNSKRHAAEKRKLASAYSMTSITSYEKFVDNCISLFCRRISEFAVSKEKFDLGHWLQCFAFDVIGEITFDKRFGFLDSGHDIGDIMSSLDTKLSYSSQVGIYHELHPILFHMNGYLQGSKETGISHTISWTNEAIADRKSQIEKEGQRDGPLDLLSKFLKSHKENPENFTEYGIFMACLQNVAAGSDTTAISLCSILYHLLKNHLALRKLRREIMEMEEKGKVSESITFQESQNLPYLQAVIKEGLRIHPAIGLPLSRVVPRGGVTINGRFFPQGTILGVNTWVSTHNRTIYSPDPDNFRPERWLDPSADISKMEKSWIPFGMGSRTCIGKHISLLEISKLIPTVVRKFDFELKMKGEEWETKEFWFAKQFGVFVTCGERWEERRES